MSGKNLDHGLFQRSWSQGEPIVVTDLQHILQGRWTPEYFVEVYGSEKITVVDCDSEQQFKSTVADFFLSFGAAEEKKQVLKLKVRYQTLPLPQLQCPCIRIGRHSKISGKFSLNYMRLLSTVPLFLTMYAPMAFVILLHILRETVSFLISVRVSLGDLDKFSLAS
jgi:hypothetical protein